MPRPRLRTRKRYPNGRLKYDKQDRRYPTALTRMRDFDVSVTTAVNPLAGYLVGVMYLRDQLESHHVGHYYSYLQMMPIHLQSIQYDARVQGTQSKSFKLNQRWVDLANYLGRDGLLVLDQLNHDRLICPISRLKMILEKVPLTLGGSRFITLAETYRAKVRPNPKPPRTNDSKHRMELDVLQQDVATETSAPTKTTPVVRSMSSKKRHRSRKHRASS